MGQESITSGNICPECPSRELGKLAIGDTCSGPKNAAMGNEDVPFCGRESLRKLRDEPNINKYKIPVIDE